MRLITVMAGLENPRELVDAFQSYRSLKYHDAVKTDSVLQKFSQEECPIDWPRADTHKYRIG
jgi:hypothetical protein